MFCFLLLICRRNTAAVYWLTSLFLLLFVLSFFQTGLHLDFQMCPLFFNLFQQGQLFLFLLLYLLKLLEKNPTKVSLELQEKDPYICTWNFVPTSNSQQKLYHLWQAFSNCKQPLKAVLKLSRIILVATEISNGPLIHLLLHSYLPLNEQNG